MRKPRSGPNQKRSASAVPWPTCGGKPAGALPRNDPHHAIKLEFVEAYGRINRLYAKLSELRRKPAAARRPSEQRRLLKAIEKAILHREQLDHDHAARGIVAVPTYRDGFTVDVSFNVPHIPPPRWDVVSHRASSHIAIPLPPGLARRS